MAALILSCSTGEGHNSCASAIKEYYDRRGEPCEIRDALQFVSDSASRMISLGHVSMYRHFHGLFRLGYRLSEKHPETFRKKAGICGLLSLGTDKLSRYIRENGFTSVICTHVFASVMVSRIQESCPLPIATCCVETDYTCTPGSRECKLDLHCIPDASLTAAFTCRTVPKERILVTGIPIRQMFYRSVSSREARLQLGIPPSHRHLLMMCGSMGCGPMKRLTGYLRRGLRDNMELSIVCGTNKRLKKSLERSCKGHPNIHILGYVQDMSLLMDSADLYLTKPGGISVTEACAKHLPMVFIDAVAGCEAYNKAFFIRRKAARTAGSVNKLAELCIDLLAKPRTLGNMRKNLEKCSRHNGARLIYDRMRSIEKDKASESAQALSRPVPTQESAPRPVMTGY